MALPRRIGLIGFGAIARELVDIVRCAAAPVAVGAILLRPNSRTAKSNLLPKGCKVVERPEDLAEHAPDGVFECAGQSAVQAYGETILSAGRDLTVISAGALADPDLLRRLCAAAGRGSAKLSVPSGAVGGIDALASARLRQMDSVVHTVVKPPRAWRGSEAELLLKLDELDRSEVFFEGSAGEAARRFPQNANVTATIGLASLGLERTTTRLIADPCAEDNLHRIEAFGAFGQMQVEMRGNALPDNPKTSMLAALSLSNAVLTPSASFVVSDV